MRRKPVGRHSGVVPGNPPSVLHDGLRPESSLLKRARGARGRGRTTTCTYSGPFRKELNVTLTLFARKNFKGRRHLVQKSHSNLKITSVGFRTKSLRTSSSADRALLFRRKRYRGKVAFVSGAREVRNLKREFFRKLRAVRIDPFTLRLNVTVVHKGNNLPGSWGSRGEATASIDAALAVVNRIWDQAMLQFQRRDNIQWRRSLRKFNLKQPLPSIPSAWKRRGFVDVVFVNRIGTGNVGGKGKPPAFGNTVMVPRRLGLQKRDVPDAVMGYALAHELGHYLGIHHPSAGGSRSNLMAPDAPQRVDPAAVRINQKQIEKVHRVLAKNLTRKGDRR